MKINKIKDEKLNKEYEVKIPAKDIDARVDAELLEVGKTITIQGFRKGKVPLKILRQKFASRIMGEVLEKTVNDTSKETLDKEGIKPAMQPDIKVKSFDLGKDLEYSMSVDIVPEFKVMDLKDIKLEKPVAEVSDKEVDEALSRVAAQNKSSQPIKTKRAAKKGDITVIDFDGSVDGEKRPGMKGEKHNLELGSGAFIPGFEDQIIGKKVGDAFDVNVTFPKEYGAQELAGKDAVFEVVLHEIREAVEAEINDEFASKLGLDSVDKLKDALRDQISKEFENLSRMKIKRALLDLLDEKHQFDIPEGMVEAEYKSVITQVINDAKSRGEDQTVSDEDKEELRSISARRVRLGLVLSEIGNEKNVVVNDQELQRAVISEAQKYPGQEAKIFDFYKTNPQALESLKAPLFEEKVVDLILESADIKEKKVSAEELAKDDDDNHPSKPKKKATAKKKAPAKKPAAKKPAGKPEAVKALAKKPEDKKPAAKKKAPAKKPTAKKSTKKS